MTAYINHSAAQAARAWVEATSFAHASRPIRVIREDGAPAV